MFGGVARLLLRRTCAFSLVVVKVLFFPLCIEEELFYVLPHTKAKLSSLLNLFLQILSFLVVKVAFEKKRRFFSNAHARSLTIFSFAS